MEAIVVLSKTRIAKQNRKETLDSPFHAPVTFFDQIYADGYGFRCRGHQIEKVTYFLENVLENNFWTTKDKDMILTPSCFSRFLGLKYMHYKDELKIWPQVKVGQDQVKSQIGHVAYLSMLSDEKKRFVPLAFLQPDLLSNY